MARMPARLAARIAARLLPLLLPVLLPASLRAFATDGQACPSGNAWDVAMAMCMPTPDEGGSTLSAHAGAFAVQSSLPGPRGGNRFAAPNWIMLDAGTSAGPGRRLDLELMATTEVWSFPRTGYPELLQVGEERADGQPYVDAQHPHSSPLMALTLAWTQALASGRSLRLSFAPRGASSDGPVAFMHRPSARDDPDAPLGHHVGQDVGHISSTVFAARWSAGRVTLEASAFNGAEPAPTHVDLPLATPDSWAVRATVEHAPGHSLAASFARVRQEDGMYPGSRVAQRWSASHADHVEAGPAAALDHTLVLGMITRDGPSPALRSLLDEGVLARGRYDAWWRLEALQRTADELALPATATSESVRWVQALTLGGTRWWAPSGHWQLGAGASLTLDRLPQEWSAAYGGRTPLTARLIVQLRADGRWQH
ncbi:MAG: hypothetical protein RL684_1458 [Pseudomonadota bacterium]